MLAILFYMWFVSLLNDWITNLFGYIYNSVQLSWVLPSMWTFQAPCINVKLSLHMTLDCAVSKYKWQWQLTYRKNRRWIRVCFYISVLFTCALTSMCLTGIFQWTGQSCGSVSQNWFRSSSHCESVDIHSSCYDAWVFVNCTILIGLDLLANRNKTTKIISTG